MASQQFYESWQIHKPTRSSSQGLVASQHYRASQVGAEVLAAGGNAVDAAVATSFAIMALEPWMSGLGGGGFMTIYDAASGNSQTMDFSLRAPLQLDPADYPLREGTGADLFNWPGVENDRNLRGYSSMAVPGQVAGLAAALERFGSQSWTALLAPAIELARKGLQVDWYATLKIAAAARDLAEFPESRRVFLPDGFVPAGQWGGPPPRIRLGRLQDTLEQLAHAGGQDFYQGDIAASLVQDWRDGGASLTGEDLQAYRTAWRTPLVHRYRDATVHATPGLSAGPTLIQALTALAKQLTPGSTPDSRTYSAYARCLLDAYTERLATLGDQDDSPDPACTTHISVVDRHGNIVALTQTLLSVFGSKVVLPGSGMLMNNGIMWFDPRPGRPNSLGAGKRPLANMCPTLLERADGSRFALGASGGRRIMPAVFQLISLLVDYPFSLDKVFRQPRLDVSGTDLVTLDGALAATIQESLAAEYRTQVSCHGVYPNLFACPNAVAYYPDGRTEGAAFVPSPLAAVATADNPEP